MLDGPPHDRERGPDEPADPSPIVIDAHATRGALVVHGLTGTPHDVRLIAGALAADGLSVRAPRLTGHTDLAALEGTTWRDWYAHADAELHALEAMGARANVVVGFSMGALLAARLAAREPYRVRAVVLLSMPLALKPWQRTTAQVLSRLRRLEPLHDLVGVYPKRGGPDIRDPQERAKSPSLRAFPYPALASLAELQHEILAWLPRIRVPVLIAHGALDKTADPEGSVRLASLVGSSHVERLTLPRSGHVVGRDFDRDTLCAAIARFAREHLHEG